MLRRRFLNALFSCPRVCYRFDWSTDGSGAASGCPGAASWQILDGLGGARGQVLKCSACARTKNFRTLIAEIAISKDVQDFAKTLRT